MLTVPQTNIAQPLNVTAFEIVQAIVTVDVPNDTLASLQLSFVAGNMSADTPPVFQQVGSTQSVSLGEAECTQLLAANPTLYATLKMLLYPAIEQQLGVTGTII